MKNNGNFRIRTLMTSFGENANCELNNVAIFVCNKKFKRGSDGSNDIIDIEGKYVTGAKLPKNTKCQRIEFDQGDFEHLKDLYRFLTEAEEKYHFMSYESPYKCPEEGSFTAYKACKDGKLVILEVPEDAKRTWNGYKTVLVDKVKVIEIIDKITNNSVTEAVSINNDSFIYRVGEVVEADTFDPENDHAIHVVMSKKDAVNYIIGNLSKNTFRKAEESNEQN